MHIVIFTHPAFIKSQSMPKYAGMLERGLKERKHTVETWTAEKFFLRIPSPASVKKWLGYLDQFLVFPFMVYMKLDRQSSNTIFVLADQALGMWAPLVVTRPHVIHCHDFLAQRSALGEIPENRVGFTGKIYQKLIRNGYLKCNNFISISKKTQSDLHRFLRTSPQLSKVVYNGLNQEFNPIPVKQARTILKTRTRIELLQGFILHVGGNQFYKNRKGVLQIYLAWRTMTKSKIPLIMIGPEPTWDMEQTLKSSPYKEEIYFLTGVPDELLKLYYQAASVLLFPSLEEGFGWPIAEAMASGCPVITTDGAPMTEVGKESCFYIPRLPEKKELYREWLDKAVTILNEVLILSPQDRQKIIEKGIKNSKRFNTQNAINEIETIYSNILKSYKK